MKNACVTGTWKINITATGGTQVPIGSEWTGIIKAKQNDSIVYGTFVTEHGLSGQLTGSVLGDMVSMTINQGPLRPGTFQGTAKINAENNLMTGAYFGGDGGGTLQATIVARKMKYYAVVLNAIKMKLQSSDPEDEKGIPLWIILLFLAGLIFLLFVFFLALHYITIFAKRFIPNFGSYITLAMILFFGIYGLYQHFRGR